MALYEYKCTHCGHEFAELRRMDEKDAEIACPQCGGSQARRTVTAASIASGQVQSNAQGCAKLGGCPNATRACTAGG